MGKITIADVGYNGITKRDINKYWILCPKSKVIYIRKTEHEALELYKILH